MRGNTFPADTARSDGAPTAAAVRSWSYIELLARLGESNLPPGGNDSVRRLVVHCHLRPGLRVLHAGCSAGYLGRELVRRSGCHVTGVDLSADMVESAFRRADEERMADQVNYRVADMRALPFPDESFDVTLSGGALPFVECHTEAVREWIRVTRRHGLIADVELFYRQSPPVTVRRSVEEIIGRDVPEYGRDDWLSLFDRHELQPWYLHEGEQLAKPDEEVREYCALMVRYAASRWAAEAQAALQKRLYEIFSAFNLNLSYMNYIVIVRKRVGVDGEPTLFEGSRRMGQ
jgi:SAM-dependent methyltransferase